MFSREVYTDRRARLTARIGSGIIFLPGNDESPMNYAANAYPFRQDSTFLYYFGLDQPHLAAVIDVDEGTTCVFGDDPTIEDIVWTGPQLPLRDLCEQVGVTQTAPSDRLEEVLKQAVEKGRAIHFLPQYRPENILRLASCGLTGSPVCRVPVRASRSTGILPVSNMGVSLMDFRGIHGQDARATHGRDAHATETPRGVTTNEPSLTLIRAVVEQRSVKSAEEIEQIETALDISRQMHLAAMKMARPGVFEYEVAGAMEGIALSHGVRLAYATIFSVHGEIMHNPQCTNRLQAGDVVVNDSGAESPLHYASDITRTIPVGGRFSSRQREMYSIVLKAQQTAIDAVRPGVEWREIHQLASVVLMEGLGELGLVKGDPQEIVAAGAHTLFFPCGVGHMLGLDVHDMEALGEDYVGYTDTIRRNPEFGWRYLRLAKAVEPGYVVTVEPGIYFIPQLIDRWHAEGKHCEFIHYDKVEAYRDFHGVRVEDNILVTADGCRVLGRPIPKTIEEVEAASSL